MIGRILAVGFVCVGMAVAQTASAPASSSAAASASAVTAQTATAGAAPAKAYRFDVISIRENKTPQTVTQFGPTEDGYRMPNWSLVRTLITAYVPREGSASFNYEDQIKGLPAWVINQRYDIDARIAEEDRAEWQKPEAQKTMLQTMLQAMLVDRCKLAVHREIKEAAVYSMVVAKGGVKFKETDPRVDHPGGIKSYGAELVFASINGERGVTMYGASMASMATFLSQHSYGGPTIQDKTGLTGRYDVLLKYPAPNEPQGEESASDPGGNSIATMLNALGLKLEPTRGQVETLVIDHMERPSEN